MSIQRFYMPLTENFVDSNNTTWTKSNSDITIKSFNDGEKEFSGMYISTKTKQISRSIGSLSVDFNDSFICKFYLARTAIGSLGHFFYIKNGIFHCYSNQYVMSINGSDYSKFKYFSLSKTKVSQLNKWQFIVIKYDGSKLYLKVDDEDMGSISIGRCTFNLPYKISVTQSGYISEFVFYSGTMDEDVEYIKADKDFLATIWSPNTISGTYQAANGLIYCYRTKFIRTSNVVNYETSRKLGVLLEILIINILYNNVIFCTLHSLLRY